MRLVVDLGAGREELLGAEVPGDLADAVRAAYRALGSLSGERAVAYRERQRVDPAGVKLAVVVDSGSAASHAAIVAREYGIPAVMGSG